MNIQLQSKYNLSRSRWRTGQDQGKSCRVCCADRILRGDSHKFSQVRRSPGGPGPERANRTQHVGVPTSSVSDLERPHRTAPEAFVVRTADATKLGLKVLPGICQSFGFTSAPEQHDNLSR